MKTRKFLLGIVASVLSLTAVAPAMAADLEASAGADFVSSYVWRGAYQSQGAAIQPGMGVSYGGVSLGAWGSTSLDATGGKELDFTLGYSVGGFSISATDYWWEGEFDGFGDSSLYFEGDNHYYEVALGYTISEDFPLTLGVATMVGGADKSEITDGQLYSTYISAEYPFAIGDVDCSGFLGVTPAEGMYGDKAGVASVGFSFSYDLVSTDKFTLPVFVETSFSPLQDDAYIVAGFSFAL